MANQMQTANLLNIIDEGQNQGFEKVSPEAMYFREVADFLSFVAETCQRMVADMAEIETEVDTLARQMKSKEGCRFLRSHLAGQAAYMRILGQLVVDLVGAAQAMRQGKPKETNKLLRKAHRGVDKGKANWHAKYKGRFKTWPIALMLVNFEGHQKHISQVLECIGD